VKGAICFWRWSIGRWTVVERLWAEEDLNEGLQSISGHACVIECLVIHILNYMDLQVGEWESGREIFTRVTLTLKQGYETSCIELFLTKKLCFPISLNVQLQEPMFHGVNVMNKDKFWSGLCKHRRWMQYYTEVGRHSAEFARRVVWLEATFLNENGARESQLVDTAGTLLVNLSIVLFGYAFGVQAITSWEDVLIDIPTN